MSETQKKLSEGIAALVRLASFADATVDTDKAAGWAEVEVSRREYSDPIPPLCPLRTLALSVLLNPSQVSGAALIDALRETGVITEEWEQVVRADEREKVIARTTDGRQCRRAEHILNVCGCEDIAHRIRSATG